MLTTLHIETSQRACRSKNKMSDKREVMQKPADEELAVKLKDLNIKPLTQLTKRPYRKRATKVDNDKTLNCNKEADCETFDKKVN